MSPLLCGMGDGEQKPAVSSGSSLPAAAKRLVWAAAGPGDHGNETGWISSHGHFRGHLLLTSTASGQGLGLPLAGLQ